MRNQIRCAPSSAAAGLLILTLACQPLLAQTSTDQRRYSFYSPELHLLAETNVANGVPAVEHEYIWFNGEPIAQVELATGTVKWTFTDHLGTPVVQTDTTAMVVWRLEREPYGKIWSVRAGADQHQPLAFPGQEEELVGAGILGGSERKYNIFRWYRAGWGRYTQADPHEVQSRSVRAAPVTEGGKQSLSSAYAYASDNPPYFEDPLGLFAVANCGCKPVLASGNPGLGQGSGAQVFYKIPPDCQVYGRQNPIPGTGQPGVTDTDFLFAADFKRYKIPGNDWFPVIYIYSDCRGGWYYSVAPPAGSIGCCGCDGR